MMPRNKRNKRLKSSQSEIPIIGEAAKQHERNKALKALAKAKELEQQRLSNGYKWITENNTRKLVKK